MNVKCKLHGPNPQRPLMGLRLGHRHQRGWCRNLGIRIFWTLIGLGIALGLAIAPIHANAHNNAHASAVATEPVPSWSLKRQLVSIAATSSPASLNQQGEESLQAGNPRAALNLWQQAETQYRDRGDRLGELGSQINQARALQALGFYQRARVQLEQVAATLDTQPDSPLKALTLLNLGNVLRVVDDLEASQKMLERSLTIAQKLSSPADIQSAIVSLAHTLYARDKVKAALVLYKKAAAEAGPIQVTAQLGEISSQIKLNQPEIARALIEKTLQDINRQSVNRISIYQKIELADIWETLIFTVAESTEDSVSARLKNLDLSQTDRVPQSEPQPKPQSEPQSKPLAPVNPAELQAIAQLLSTTWQQAEQIADRRAQSLALGKLGHLYEQTQQWPDAERLTQKAWAIAYSENASDIAYQWQWQLGRLRVAQGDTRGAIAAYTQTFNTLQTLRQDLIAINQSAQFSFRDQIEPVYRQLVSLLLQEAPPSQSLTTAPARLQFARHVIESLQLAALTNFSREACIDAQPKFVDQVDPHAAVIYPIVLSDRLEVILSLPHQPLRHYATHRPQAELEASFHQMRQSLRSTSFAPERLAIAQTLYNWLIQPAAADLQHAQIHTLVFILDDTLRNLPMSALHDGTQYLVEQYNIALTPGMQFFPGRPFPRRKIQALVAGLSDSQANFAALPAVSQEVIQISQILASKPLLNQAFTLQAIQTQLSTRPLSIVHLATHGQFSSKADQTFIQAWDGRLTLSTLGSLLAQRTLKNLPPIDLMVLSACKTAQGDKRAALGLAGVAVKSGARSILATLWQVNDEATATFMTQFYTHLIQPQAKTYVTKAEAVRQAQLELLRHPEFSHPYYWSAFVLVGSWQ
jgi:CHAT domain-containing protein